MTNRLHIGVLCLILGWTGESLAQATLAEKYTALAVRGDLSEAPRLFASAATRSDSADADLAARFQQRFVERSEPAPPPTGDSLVDAALQGYRRYWNDALLSGQPPRFEPQLRIELERALGHAGSMEVDSAEDVFSWLSTAFAQTGFHAMVDFAPPLQDLIVWTEQRPAHFTVDLGDQVMEVEVLFLSGFLSQGWKHYASLDLATTTGWVGDGRLYCVEWAYRPGSEAFDISFLKHESRHLADYRHFPGLDATELEYRAKLTELAFARATLRRLLDDFSAKSAADSGSPHAEANARVVADLYLSMFGREYTGELPWASAEPWLVHRAALQLLDASTTRLETEYGLNP